jgi:predicted short-subunit dehydrogenase-like oxidoreductase (DUF2520 family)
MPSAARSSVLLSSAVVAAKPTIAIVGAGKLGSTLALALRKAGYGISEIVHRDRSESRRNARVLARELRARAATATDAKLDADIVWLCVSDAAITSTARELALRTAWKGKIALHSSGALPSDELRSLARRGAVIGSLHPMMTFVRGSSPDLRGLSFAVEGDPHAVRVARRIARDLGGRVFDIRSEAKALYHASGSFASPLTVTTLMLAEQAAGAAGLKPKQARSVLAPIIQRTIENYLKNGPQAAFSGPIARGDIVTVQRHLQELRKLPAARAAYVALVRAAMEQLPVRGRRELSALLKRETRNREH